jgi:hypothetical protein
MDTVAPIEWLIATDVDSWTEYREEKWVLAREFRAGGRLTETESGRPALVGGGGVPIGRGSASQSEPWPRSHHPQRQAGAAGL